MPRFLYLLRNAGGGTGEMSPEEMQQVVEKYVAWIEKLKAADQLVAAEKLADGHGRVVRKSQGIIKDGPYSEAKEIVGGFWIVQVQDYDAAVALSEDLPYGNGTLEIRQIQDQ